jgi:anti-sigma regulatory factor (Ser/Thr protein kinase)
MARRLTILRQRFRRCLSEMNYAQRRLFEIRTGLGATNTVDHARDKAMIAQLEAHWRL